MYGQETRARLCSPHRSLRENCPGIPPDPESLAFVVPDFENIERTQLDIGNPAGKGLSGLSEQINRCRAEEQKPTVAAPLVYENAKGLEQFRRPLHLVNDDQVLFVSGKVEGGIGQFLAVRCVLEVEIEARPLPRDESGQRGLACLTRAQDSHGRKLIQPGANDL